MSIDKIIAAVSGASVAELATIPICTLKTVYQSGKQDIRTSFRDIYSRKGIWGFYSGSLPAICAQIFASTYKLFLFSLLIKRFEDPRSLFSSFDNDLRSILTGIISSTTCVLFTNPIDYIRVSYQMGNKMTLSSAYNGVVPNLAKGVVGGATFLPIRKILMDHFPETKSWKLGVCTAVLSTIIVHPLDYFKTYLLSNKSGAKLGGLHKTSPLRNPYRGLSLNLARIVPHFVIMTEVMDYMERALN